MLDRPLPADAALAVPAQAPRPRWPFIFTGLAGLMGAAGVAVGAAGAHGGGGDLARTASEFLLIHAAAVVAAAGVALAARRTSGLLVAAMGLLTVGAILFGGELAVAALLDWRPVPLAAPAGGLCLIAGWIVLAGASVALAIGRR